MKKKTMFLAGLAGLLMGGCTEDNSVHTSNITHNHFYPDVTQMQPDTSRDSVLETYQDSETQITPEEPGTPPPSTPPPNDPHICNEPVEYLVEVMGKHLATGDAAIFCSEDGQELGFEDIISTDYHGCQFMSKEGEFGVAALRLSEEPAPLSIFTKFQEDPYFQTINYTELAQGKNWVAVSSECEEKSLEKANKVTDELLDYCPNLQITVTQECDPDVVIIPGDDTPGPTVIPDFCYNPITLVKNLNADFLNNKNTNVDCSTNKFEADEFDNLFETEGYGCIAMNDKEDIILFSLSLDQPLNSTAYDKIKLEVAGNSETAYIDMQDGELYAGIIAPCDSNMNQVNQLKNEILEICPNYQLQGELKCFEEAAEPVNPGEPIPEDAGQEFFLQNINQDMGELGHPLGDSNAPIKVYEFGNYDCGFCTDFHNEVFDKIKENYVDTGLVQWIYRPMPFEGWTGAMIGAEAAECADNQGQYWGMHDKLFTLGVPGITGLKDYATELEMNVGEFSECLLGKDEFSTVYEYIIAADQLDVQGIPSFYIGTTTTTTGMFSGFLPYEGFQQIMDEELDKL